MHEAVIVSAVRSGVAKGKADGSLANVHPVDLAADVIKGAVQAAGIQPKDLCDVMLGCASPEGAQGTNIARMAVLRAGFPYEVAGTTVNRFCSSGLQTVAMAAASIMTGMADTVIAGGVEMMSRIPMGGHHKELHPEMTEAYIGMGFTAENVAERWGINREDQDAWALRSHQRAAAALAEGRFDDEIVPVRVNGGEFRRDELVRADTSLEKLSGLRPAFKATGTVTAGNASPYSDGAGALVLTSREKAEAEGLPILARFVGFGTSGVAPEIMGIAPALAVPNALKRTGMTMADIDLIEFNEAFAAQVLAVMRDIGLPEEKTNVNGGAIALGHPLGATGAKLSTQLIHELRRRGGGMGLVTMCVGGGMGAAGIFEVYGS
ncbi:thiolase family protein [Longimicrobium sp.]|uniref:thiolase family protein n=1 Tax=Longimicrobium sp. TaxID=2029185 RepID=UPI003B3BD713